MRRLPGAPKIHRQGVMPFVPTTCCHPHQPVRYREARPIDETADKLDGMMELVFEHLHRHGTMCCYQHSCSDPLCSRLRAGDLESTLQTLLRALQTSLLTTYKSKFTQVFHILGNVCALSLNLAPVPGLLCLREGLDDARGISRLPAAGACLLCRQRCSDASPMQLEKISDTTQSSILRIAAASYAASFLASCRRA